MSGNWETEHVTEIWNNDTGEHFEVGPDRDGTDQIEVRYYARAETESSVRVCIPVECGDQVGDAIKNAAQRMKSAAST